MIEVLKKIQCGSFTALWANDGDYITQNCMLIIAACKSLGKLKSEN